MIWLKILAYLALIVAAGACYRYGGSAAGVRWVREIGVALCLNLALLVLGVWNYGSILIFGSIWIESTYFKIKGAVTWFSWILIGLSFSVALLPWFLWQLVASLIHHAPVHWIGFLARAVVCTILTIIWQFWLSDIVAKWFQTTKDITDENGRGEVQLITLPIAIF